MDQYLPFIPGFVAAFSILFLAASSPGPAVAMLVGIATTQGRGPALVASSGIAFGSLCINILTMVGVGLLLTQIAWAMTILRLLGAAYLLYLAYGAFKRAAQPPELATAQVTKASNAKYFGMGFLLQVTNPKAITFWLAIASVGATVGGGIDVILAFIIGCWCISFICHGAWAIFLSSLSFRKLYQSGRWWVEASVGAFMALMAFKLATERG